MINVGDDLSGRLESGLVFSRRLWYLSCSAREPAVIRQEGWDKRSHRSRELRKTFRQSRRNAAIIDILHNKQTPDIRTGRSSGGFKI